MKKTAWILFIFLLFCTVTVWAAPIRQSGPVLQKQLGVSELTLTAPGVSEKWQQGTMHKIAWTFKGRALTIDTVKIELFYAEKLVATLAKNHPIGGNGIGSFSWKIPDNQPIGAAYTIIVTSEKDAGVSAKSNMVFIDSSTAYAGANNTTNTTNIVPALEVSAPQAGDTWVAGNSYEIRWDFNFVEARVPVRVELLRGDEVIAKLGHQESPPGQRLFGNMGWQVGNEAIHLQELMTANNYRIRVISDKNASVQAVSKPFTIVWPYVRLTSPSDHATFYRGSTYIISWKGEDGASGSVDIIILAADIGGVNKCRATIAQNVPLAQGSIKWTVPNYSEDILKKNNNIFAIMVLPCNQQWMGHSASVPDGATVIIK